MVHEDGLGFNVVVAHQLLGLVLQLLVRQGVLSPYAAELGLQALAQRHPRSAAGARHSVLGLARTSVCPLRALMRALGAVQSFPYSAFAED